MFDGVPGEHFHRFISTPSSRIIPPNSSLIQTPPISTSTNLNFLSFDPFPPPLHHQALFQSNHFVRDHYNDTESKEIDLGLDPWSNDEVIQLLRIKSSSENWFKDFTWDHVSRKLAEMGYKRSSEKCKEKFEEETCRSFSSTIGYNKSSSGYLITEELDEHLSEHHVTIESPDENIINHQQLQLEKGGEQNPDFENDPPAQDDSQVAESKKRKRKHKKFKMVKGLCVDLVNKMMAQQEEMHKKLLEDMAKRDMKREEAWRKGEMEIQSREHEQEMARDSITQFLNKITSFEQKIQIPFNMMNLQADLEASATKPMSLSAITKLPSNQDEPKIAKDDETGKRWPRDEVLALINIRSIVNNGNINSDGGGGGRSGSLWERISQGMLEFGYKRSAKRCKEKWENINKYFRKTKDANKKRSLESRTCPYYHELSKLYNQEPSFHSSTAQDLLTTKITYSGN